MTRVVRAVSTTSLVTRVSSLMLRIRWIWTKSRWMSRKVPLVIRALAAIGVRNRRRVRPLAASVLLSRSGLVQGL
jgi:hypothetical protein